MKQSIYNTIITIGSQQVLYNTLTNKYVVLSKSITDALNCNEPSPLSSRLLSNNFLVNDDVDELEMIKSLFIQRRYSSKIYQLTINTSLDCNLGCWYCYETHSSGTHMSSEIVDRILLHLEIKSNAEPFKVLKLSFFGGEPLLNYKAIQSLLTGVSKLSEQFGFAIHLTFVTNGTLISRRYIELLKNYKTVFQVTIDGNRERHDNTRKYKNAAITSSSYDRIISNLRLLNENSTDFHFIIRVNYENDTLQSIPALMSDIGFLDKKRTVLSLHRIWQHKSASDELTLLMKAIEHINSLGYMVSTFPLSMDFENCYADNFNQAVINFDGRVFKCTARDFSKEKPTGRLNSLGIIEWNTSIVQNRLMLEIPTICQKCKLLPSCPGICSQKHIESAKDIATPCPFENSISKEDIIRLNIKQQIVTKRNEKVCSNRADVLN